MIRTFIIAQIILLLFINSAFAEKVDKIIVSGNERISKETLLMFGKVNLNDDICDNTDNVCSTTITSFGLYSVVIGGLGCIDNGFCTIETCGYNSITPGI